MQNSMRPDLVLLIAGIATFVLMGAGQSLYGPALPALARGYAIGVAEAGLIISAHWVGCAAGVAAMFLASHRFAPVSSPVIMLAGAGLVAAGLGWGVTLAGGFVFGFGYGTATVIVNRRLLTGFGARGPAMVSLVNAMFGIGAIGAPLVFVGLGSHVGLTFGLVAGLAVITAVIAFPLRASPREARPESGRFRPHIGILLVGMAAIGTEASLIGLGPVALIALGKTEVQAAELLSGFFVGFLAIRLALTLTAHLVAPLALLVGSLVVAAVGCLITLLISPGAGFVLLGLCAGLFFPPYFVCATALMGNDPRVTPTIIAGGLVGGIVSPLLIRVVMTRFGDATLFWVLGGLTIGTALLVVVFAARLRGTNAPA